MRQQQSPRDHRRKKENEKYAINEEIRAPEVRLIGVNGEQIGILGLAAALAMAEENGVDVVEVAPEGKPPVCRLLDYGKLRYREQKKAAEARKKSASQVVKELRLRYNTDKHDLETKVRNARKFILEGDRVRFQMRFKGREVVYQELGREILKNVIEMLQDVAAVEEESPLIGSRIILSLVPKGAVKHA